MYPNITPRSHTIARSFPAARIFSTELRMTDAAQNWPFLTFTIRPVFAAAVTLRSVCLHRNAGI